MITATQLRTIAGTNAKGPLIAAIVAGWPSAVAKAKLTTKLRACHFLAQIMTETGGLQILEESGAYSANRIMEIFGEGHHSAAITPAEARRIAALPVAQRGPVLFNRVYGTGNPKKMREFKNTGANDGWLYRGGGMMQATGKSNYAIMEKKTGLPLVAHPELLHQPAGAFTAAYLEWAQDGRCNAAADRDDVVAVRKIINGGSNGLAECRRFLGVAKRVLADYSAAPVQTFVAAPDPVDDDAAQDQAQDQVDDQAEDAAGEDAPAPAAADPRALKNPELYAVKRRLKAMHYNCGILNDEWGSMTAGAIAGFINDRGGNITPPASLDAFNQVAAEIRAEITSAEDADFVRPVSDARASGDLATVAKVAPEVVPVHRNFLVTAWTATATFFAGVVNSASDYISQAWDFFTDHKDDLPSDPGMLSTAWAYLHDVPALVWCTLAAIAIGLVALNSWNGVKKITEQVKTGARQ